MDPADYTGQEKRITFQLYHYWFGLSGDHGIPPLKLLTPRDIAPYKDNMVLIDLRDPDNEPTLSVIGQLLSRDLDPAPKIISDIPRRTLLSRITDHYMEVLANRSPISFDAEFKNADREKILYRGILLPFSDDGEDINFILGAVRWISEQDKLNPARPADDPPTAGATTAVLLERLEACRQLVQGGSPAEIRSRRALYDMLGAVLEFHELCCSAPENYTALLRAEGLKRQERAPFTPTLKLCFGRDYDKTRLTEYAMVLSHARKNHLSASDLPDFLESFPGGIKGCVRAERDERQSKVPPAGNQGETAQNDYQAIADTLPSLASFEMPVAEIPEKSGKLCLLLARREEARFDVVRILENDKKRLGQIIKQLSKDPGR